MFSIVCNDITIFSCSTFYFAKFPNNILYSNFGFLIQI